MSSQRALDRPRIGGPAKLHITLHRLISIPELYHVHLIDLYRGTINAQDEAKTGAYLFGDEQAKRALTMLSFSVWNLNECSEYVQLARLPQL